MTRDTCFTFISLSLRKILGALPETDKDQMYVFLNINPSITIVYGLVLGGKFCSETEFVFPSVKISNGKPH